MGCDVALDEERALVRVDSSGEKHGCKLAGLTPKLLWVLLHGDGVKIDDAEKVVLLILPVHPAFECAQIVAQLRVARGLDSAEHSPTGF